MVARLKELCNIAEVSLFQKPKNRIAISIAKILKEGSHLFKEKEMHIMSRGSFRGNFQQKCMLFFPVFHFLVLLIELWGSSIVFEHDWIFVSIVIYITPLDLSFLMVMLWNSPKNTEPTAMLSKSYRPTSVRFQHACIITLLTKQCWIIKQDCHGR